MNHHNYFNYHISLIQPLYGSYILAVELRTRLTIWNSLYVLTLPLLRTYTMTGYPPSTSGSHAPREISHNIWNKFPQFYGTLKSSSEYI